MVHTLIVKNEIMSPETPLLRFFELGEFNSLFIKNLIELIYYDCKQTKCLQYDCSV